MSTEAPPTPEEMLSILASVERVAPHVVKAFITAVLKSMPRQEYLRFIQQVERMR